MVDNRYNIENPLGKGSTGEVVLAYDAVLRRNVALKFLWPFLENDPGYLSSLRNEARAAAALNHPNIVQIYDFERFPENHVKKFSGRLFISMEYVDGCSILDWKNDEPTLSQILDIGVQICNALAYAHSKQVIHRDLKPDNIFVTKDREVKLLDFGLAKSNTHSRDLTKDRIVGTAHYMSPEQADGQDVDHRTDIFSFGVVLYEMTTGDKPFQGETLESVIHAIQKKKPKRMRSFNKEISRSLQKIVSGCLAKNTERRFQSATIVAEMLETERRKIIKKTNRVWPRILKRVIKILLLIILILLAYYLRFEDRIPFGFLNSIKFPKI